MKVTISPAPAVVIPPREVTITMTEEQAKDLRLFLGQQGALHYQQAFNSASRHNSASARNATKMQSTGDAVWDALCVTLQLPAGM